MRDEVTESRDPVLEILQAAQASGSSVLFVASTGGHLSELTRLVDRYGFRGKRHWATFDSEQSSSLLAQELVTVLPYIRPRHLWGTLRSVLPLYRLLVDENVDIVVSTGAAVAMSAFLAARLRRIRALYIESAARVHGPSATGRIVHRLGLASTFSQTQAWDNWIRIPSVFQDYVRDVHFTSPGQVGHISIFVSLGTIRPYRFDSAIEAILRILPSNCSIVWQVGSTVRDDLPGSVYSVLGYDQIKSLMQSADVVITHCGVGSVLGALEAGKVPIVIPRRRIRGEHVDDHQSQLAEYLTVSDTAIVRSPSELTIADLLLASRIRARLSRGTS